MGSWRKILGALLILVGFAALVTPLTPGSWLIFVGAELLGIEILNRARVMAFLRGLWPQHAALIMVSSAVLAGALAFLGYWLAFRPAL
jgi:uncharacterized protein YqgC (DUF456 family)